MSVGRIQTEGDLARFIRQTLGVDAKIGAIARQLQGVLLFGDGAPSGAPAAPRAVYIDAAGGVNTTLYVWEGSAWRAL
jgi:hypothetical protein